MLIPTDLLRAAAMFAAKKDSRFYLESVCVEWRDDTAKLIATDGHRMFVASFAIEPDGDGDGACIVPSDTVKRALTGNKDDTVAFGPPALDIASIGGVTFEPIRAEYPDWRRVVPADASGEAAQFNAAYVADIGKAARLLMKHSKTMPAESLVHIHHNGVFGALVTFGARTDCIAVIMPKMRGEMDADEALNIAEAIKA